MQTCNQPGLGQVGYLITSTAETPVRDAFACFRNKRAANIIAGSCYNGGSPVRLAEVMGDLMGRDRLASDPFSLTAYRPSKSVGNSTRPFRATPKALPPYNLAFMTTDASASASELVINSIMPCFHNRLNLVSANTSSKTVVQIAIYRAACNERLRILVCLCHPEPRPAGRLL